ncbi:hypothetical protein DL769_011125 [Monosporascus sp. CRB-8-3]|nr:hypothetical protein DL769_011125 [Monosporascus sp. CRB-8-3]
MPPSSPSAWRFQGLKPRNATSTGPNSPTTSGAMGPYLENCNDDEAKEVREAWEEAGTLAAAHYEWVPGGKRQPAMDMYLGKTTKSDWSFFWGKGARLRNIERQYAVHYAAWGSEPLWTYGYFYCDGKGQRFKTCKPPNVTAYPYDDLGWTWSAHKVVFCPKFFDDTVFKLSQKRAPPRL